MNPFILLAGHIRRSGEAETSPGAGVLTVEAADRRETEWNDRDYQGPPFGWWPIRL